MKNLNSSKLYSNEKTQETHFQTFKKSGSLKLIPSSWLIIKIYSPEKKYMNPREKRTKEYINNKIVKCIIYN